MIVIGLTNQFWVNSMVVVVVTRVQDWSSNGWNEITKIFFLGDHDYCKLQFEQQN